MTYLKGEAVTLPLPAHVRFIRRALERERGMRQRVLSGKARDEGVAEMDHCLFGLSEIEKHLSQSANS